MKFSCSKYDLVISSAPYFDETHARIFVWLSQLGLTIIGKTTQQHLL